MFLQRVKPCAVEEHVDKVSIGDKNTTNLRFADDLDDLDKEEQELGALIESLDKICTKYTKASEKLQIVFYLLQYKYIILIVDERTYKTR